MNGTDAGTSTEFCVMMDTVRACIFECIGVAFLGVFGRRTDMHVLEELRVYLNYYQSSQATEQSATC